MERLTREMTFEEEYTFLKKEVKELFDKEDKESEPHESHNVVRRALRCIKKHSAELEPYKAYKDLDEQGLLLQLPVKVGDTIWYVDDDDDNYPIEAKITRIEIKETYILYYAEEKEDCGTLGFDSDHIGKTVFLTQAEAEQKLKEMESK